MAARFAVERSLGLIAGAGPLLQRAMLLVSRRYSPGDLLAPSQAGLHSATICRSSGKLAGPDCPPLVEHFVGGTTPAETCDWHRGGTLSLPPKYAEWHERDRQVPGGSSGVSGVSVARATAGGVAIISPKAGDHYRVPPGVEPRFASIALRASGGGGSVRWYVDGVAIRNGRWPLRAGQHEVLAVAGAARDSVIITVEAP